MKRFFDICGQLFRQLFSTLVASPRPTFLEYIQCYFTDPFDGLCLSAPITLVTL